MSNDWGFTTLERDIFTKQVFEDRALLQLYVYLRSQAKYKPTRKLINNQWRELQPGELTVGNKQLAAVLGVSTSTAFRMLRKLQKLGEITAESLTSCTLVRLAYWPQRDETESETEMKSKNAKSEKGSSHTATRGTADFLGEDENEMKTKWKTDENEMKTPITGYKDNRKTKDTTTSEREILNTLKRVENYPFDYEKDLAYIRILSTDFPTVDLLAEMKKWSAYKLDKPLTKKSNPRSQLRTWMSKAMEFKQRSEPGGKYGLDTAGYAGANRARGSRKTAEDYRSGKYGSLFKN